MLCFFILLSLTATAQNLLFEDDFANNKNGWAVQEDANFRVAIENNVLHLEKFEKNFTSRGCLWYNKTIPRFNTLNNFSIILYAKYLSGGDLAEMIDLQWGECSRTENGRLVSCLNQLTFLFTERVSLERFEQKWTNRVTEYVSSDAIACFDPKQLNKYEVEQRDGFVVFRLNDKEVFRQRYTPVAGNSIGFQQCLKSAWEIDKIVIHQQPTLQATSPYVVNTQ